MGKRRSSEPGERGRQFVCPQCGLAVRESAHYCSRCGTLLAGGATPDGGASRMTAAVHRHPRPLAAPEGMTPLGGGRELYFRLETAWGGRQLGSETLALVLFNGGYPLSGVVLEISGIGGSEGRAFRVRQDVERLPRGEVTRVEVPSYELPDDPREISVALSSAEVDDDSD